MGLFIICFISSVAVFVMFFLAYLAVYLFGIIGILCIIIIFPLAITGAYCLIDFIGDKWGFL